MYVCHKFALFFKRLGDDIRQVWILQRAGLIEGLTIEIPLYASKVKNSSFNKFSEEKLTPERQSNHSDNTV